MKSFYDFYSKLQKISEENAPPIDPKVMDLPKPEGDMPMSMPSDEEMPKLVDKSSETPSEEDDDSNLSPPEGKINFKFINKNLKHITKHLPKFKNLDQEKGEQLDQLLSQISNLINSFEGSEEEEPTEEPAPSDASPDMDSDNSMPMNSEPMVPPAPSPAADMGQSNMEPASPAGGNFLP